MQDIDAFFAFLATTPLIRSIAERRAERETLPLSAKPAAKAGPDKELLDALKSMA